MSEEIFENIKYSLTSFYGGTEKGRCLQLTVKSDKCYIQLTEEEVLELMFYLFKWLLKK